MSCSRVCWTWHYKRQFQNCFFISLWLVHGYTKYCGPWIRFCYFCQFDCIESRLDQIADHANLQSLLYYLLRAVVQLLVNDYLFSTSNWWQTRFVLREIMHAIPGELYIQVKNKHTRTINNNAYQQEGTEVLVVRGGVYFFDLANLLFEHVLDCLVNNSSSWVSFFVSFQSPGDKNIRYLQWHYQCDGVPENGAGNERDSEAVDGQHGDPHTNHAFQYFAKPSVHGVNKSFRKQKSLVALKIYGRTTCLTRQYRPVSSVWRSNRKHPRFQTIPTSPKRSVHGVNLGTKWDLCYRSSLWLSNRTLSLSTAMKWDCVLANS